MLGELRAANQAFLEAREHLTRGTGDPLVEAGVLDLEASLRRDQRRFPEALALVERALSAYSTVGRQDLAARALVGKAKISADAGDFETAIAILAEAEPLAEAHGSDHLCFAIQNNRVLYLAELDRFAEAGALLPEVRRLTDELGSDIDQIRLQGIEGRIALGTGHVGRAEAAFRAAQHGFLEHRMGYDAALAVLDLAVLYAREGAVQELKRLAAEVIPAFESREVQREAFAALLAFQHACEEETATVVLLRHLATMLRLARRPPAE